MAALGKRVFEFAVIVGLLAAAAQEAYRIRMYAINMYGRLIHEFDPWFNYRATEYLAQNGATKFFTWFDHRSWYPLGRPVGTTIYPGMQFLSVGIWHALKWGNKYARRFIGVPIKMSLNDVCVFVPAWFGAVASLATGLLTAEVSGSWRAGAAAASIMAVVPAHIMRSVGGAYDNESVAMTAMCTTFALWCLSLRSPRHWPLGVLAGAAYGFMAWSWGGYNFVANMVAVHAAFLVLIGRTSSHLRWAYSLWYWVGTFIAIQAPVVGMAPFRSAELLGPLLVFVGLWAVYAADTIAARAGRSKYLVRAAFIGAGLAVAAALVPTGIFGPFSVRVRSLFIKHTRTGNPLVDSVAEHQPGSARAYRDFLHFALYLIPPGLVVALLQGAREKVGRTYGVAVTKWFIVLYAAFAFYFATKMVRLVILLGPVGSSLAGIAIGAGVDFLFAAIADTMDGVTALATGKEAPMEAAAAADAPASAPAAADAAADATPSKGKKRAAAAAAAAEAHWIANYPAGSLFVPFARSVERAYASPAGRVIRLVLGLAAAAAGAFYGRGFWEYADMYARQSSQPSIVFKARLSDNREVIIDDYLKAYLWLKDNTPKDSRVLSWWDYGYQISGIGERITLADGNTWNLEHIALLGRILTSPEKKAHALARHLADYVLVWAGNQGDDLAKSPHMARIGSSVFDDICPKDDPLCHSFGFFRDGSPSPSMAASMLYKMHSNGLKPGVTVDPRLFREVHRTQYGLVRIYEILNISTESRDWLADPANRLCDRPGSWYCPGQYPPGFERPPPSHRHLDYDAAGASGGGLAFKSAPAGGGAGGAAAGKGKRAKKPAASA